MTATANAILWGSMGPNSHSSDTDLEAAVGKTQSLVHLAWPWTGNPLTSPPYYSKFPVDSMNRASANGAIVCLNWASWNLSARLDTRMYLDTIIAGAHDAFLHSWFQDAAAWKTAFQLRYDWEMQGDWFKAWGNAGNNTPAKFVAAWKHVVDICRAEGATNVTWVWCPNICSLSPTSNTFVGTPPKLADGLARWYPGPDYCHWTGVDGYNFAMDVKPANQWLTFKQVFRGFPGWLADSVAAIKSLAPDKPMMIGETNCADDPRKAAWWLDALARLPLDLPEIKALLIFNWNPGTSTWALHDDALEAFRLGIASPMYLPAGVWQPADMQPMPAPPIIVGPQDNSLSLQLAASKAETTQARADTATAAAAILAVQSTLDTARAHVLAVSNFGANKP